MSGDINQTIKPENSETAGSENSESNPEFETLLLEATKTKEQERQEEKSGNSSGDVISDEQAAQIAANGLGGLVAIANQFGGYDIEIPNETAQLAVGLFCPLIKKYGNKFKFDPSGVDLNGWMPEVMALGGAGVIGFTVKRQIESKKQEAASNGNQSEHSA